MWAAVQDSIELIASLHDRSHRLVIAVISLKWFAALIAVPVLLLQICGEANVGVIREAARAGVPRCAFISVHDYNFPGMADQRPWPVHTCHVSQLHAWDETLHLHAFTSIVGLSLQAQLSTLRISCPWLLTVPLLRGHIDLLISNKAGLSAPSALDGIALLFS